MIEAPARMKIGILGGMGPAAGLHFAHKLVELNTGASEDNDHASFVLYSDPAIPSRVQAYLHDGPNPTATMVGALNQLAAMGAGFGVVICNTAHIYIDQVERQSALPIINMIANAVQAVERTAPGARVGLLATAATVRSGLYPRYFEGSSNVIVAPREADQALITAAIFDPEFGIKATRTCISERARDIIAELADRMRREDGISRLILGCTELSMAVQAPQLHGLAVIDPVLELAHTCLRHVGLAADAAC